MELFVRFTLYVTLVAGTVAGVAYSQPNWLANLGLDFWSLPELEQIVSESRERSEQLDEARFKMKDRASRKKVIVQDLTDGRITLGQAAQTILEIDDEHFLWAGAESLNLQCDSLEEVACRMLIFWAEQCHADDPEAALATREHLERELEEYLNVAE